MAPSKSISSRAFLAASLLATGAFAQWQDTRMCNSGTCLDCPWRTTESETGFPRCRIYETAEFAGDFPTSVGGMEVYFDIQQPDPGCAMIIRTPAGTDLPGCGQNAITARNAACAFLTLSNTFMLSWCCGDGDCAAAGASRVIDVSGLNSRDTISISSSGVASSGGMLLSRNGTVIQPKEEGYPPETREAMERLERQQREVVPSEVKRSGGAVIPSAQLQKRDCVFTQEGASFTFPGETRVIEGPFTGPIEPTISSEETVGWSSTVSAGISSDIFSVGAEFTTEESVTSGISITFPVPAGQTGFIVWTPIRRCRRGTLSDCGADTGPAEACFPETNSDGSVRGSWAFQQRF